MLTGHLAGITRRQRQTGRIIDIANHDLCPFGHKSFDCRQANAAGAAGDHRHLAGETIHSVLSSWWENLVPQPRKPLSGQAFAPNRSLECPV